MYNKLFNKILDSSIWLESDKTRIVWLTMLSAMDEVGFCQFAAPANLAHRARVSVSATEKAVQILSSPDKNSSDSDNEGRRIERVEGGWLVLNAQKYRRLATKVMSLERTRERVRKFRERNGNGAVTPCNDHETPSYARAEAKKTTTTSEPPVRDDDVHVREVFNYYLGKLKRNPNLYQFTANRKRVGARRYRELLANGMDPEAAVAMMKLAVDGLAKSPFHAGQNDQKKKYVEWESHLFKTFEQMEKWYGVSG